MRFNIYGMDDQDNVLVSRRERDVCGCATVNGERV